MAFGLVRFLHRQLAQVRCNLVYVGLGGLILHSFWEFLMFGGLIRYNGRREREVV